MSEKTLITLAAVVLVFALLFVNITRVVWVRVSPDVNVKLKEENACLQGGGKSLRNGLGEYYACEKPKLEE